MSEQPRDEATRLFQAVITQKDSTIGSLLRFLKLMTARVADEEEGNEPSMLYAVYEVNARGASAFLAVCLDNPFIYAVEDSRKKAGEEIRRLVAKFYSEDAPLGRGLDGLEIPDSLPEVF